MWLPVISVSAEEFDLRLRVAWGGAERTRWSGSISIDRGEFSNIVPLGIESDESGNVWHERNSIRIREGFPRDYGGIDVSVQAPEDAYLIFRLKSEISGVEAITEADIRDLVDGEHRVPLDSSGNYLLVTRAPGDRLRVKVERKNLIYSPGETVSLLLNVSPELLENIDDLELLAEVAQARGGAILHKQDSKLSRDELLFKWIPLTLPAPRQEGVYEAQLILRRRPGIAERFVPAAGANPVAKRRIQFVVFDGAASALKPSLEWEEIASIDLASPNWSTRVPTWVGLEKLPGVPERPLSNVAHATANVLGRPSIILPAPAPDRDRAWYAVPVSVADPGVPHLLTIDVPQNKITQLGLSILERNAGGYVYPVSRDFGIFSTGTSDVSTAPWTTQRYLFWPKTESPTVLLSNEHPNDSVHLGVLRLYRARTVQSAPTDTLPSSDRRVAAVLVGRPWLAESLGAREVLDAVNNQSVDDWLTFYEAATRLVDYVQLAGYNAAVLSAWADGSTIYPSEHLQGTPRYDTGILSSTALDPLRKDFLELLLSAFDRAGLLLYVGLEFSTPLPELEELRRQTDSQFSGIEWIGADGKTWAENQSRGQTSLPCYNLLNPSVQNAMLQVVQEVVTRYEGHPSLRGIALQLTGFGYGQLLEPQWGLDDNTVAQFERDTGIQVPGGGPQRFATREKFLMSERRKEWITWRSQVVSQFYAQMCDVVRSGDDQRELLLLPTRLFERPEVRARLRPSLATRVNLPQLLFEMGIDTEQLGSQEGLVFLRPTFDTPLVPLADAAVEHQVSASRELGAALGKEGAGGDLVYYSSLSRRRRIISFDQKNHFGENRSYTAPISQMRPTGSLRGRALASLLASRDPSTFVEGGSALVTELDSELQRSLEIFRQLPNGECKRTLTRQQPITVRTYHTEVDSIVCVINESPWSQEVEVSLEAPGGTQLLEIGTLRAPITVPMEPPRTQWRISMAGYAVHAARVSAPSARVTKVQFQPSKLMKEELAKRIEELRKRAEQMVQVKQDRPILELENPSFEREPIRTAVPGWTVLNPLGGSAEIDTGQPKDGARSLRITSLGPAISVASSPFTCPPTGRLALSAHIRRAPESQDVSVYMIVEDDRGGTAYRAAGILGQRSVNKLPIHTQWQNQPPYRFPVSNVPVGAQHLLRIRFEVIGEGTIWIDNVLVTDESLGNHELELAKIIYQAGLALDEGSYTDCLESLEGFWPRYLAAHVTLPADTRHDIAETQKPAGTTEARQAISPQGVADRIKQIFKK